MKINTQYNPENYDIPNLKLSSVMMIYPDDYYSLNNFCKNFSGGIYFHEMKKEIYNYPITMWQ